VTWLELKLVSTDLGVVGEKGNDKVDFIMKTAECVYAVCTYRAYK